MYCKYTGQPLHTTPFLRPEPNATFYQIIRDIGCSMFLEADRSTVYLDNRMYLQLDGVTVATFNFADGVCNGDNNRMTYSVPGYKLVFIVHQQDNFGPGRLYISCPVLTLDIK